MIGSRFAPSGAVHPVLRPAEHRWDQDTSLLPIMAGTQVQAATR